MKFGIPVLPFEMNALEPHISKKNLELHFHVHHQSYLTNLNKLISGTKFENMDLITIIKIADGPVYNNAAQLWNHEYYFDGLIPGTQNKINESFEDIIKSSFGSMSFFKDSFSKAATTLFGAGWIWLIRDENGMLEIVQKNNAGNPLRAGLVPVMVCDLWEHAYYLDYHNSRTNYINAFWEIINWDIVEKRYMAHDSN